MRSLVAGLAWLLLSSEILFAQVGALNRNPTEQSEDLFLLAPRSLLRLYREGQSAIEQQRYSDAVSALGTLLIEPPSEPGTLQESVRQDYFQPSTEQRVFRSSIRGDALRLLGELPESGRKSLEIRYGVTAKQQLQEAIKARNFEAIAEVARLYFHTEAGYDATLIMAEERLARGFPLAAAVMLNRLTEFSHSRKRYGARLFGTLANCWLHAQRPASAVEQLQVAAKHFPGEKIQLLSREIELREDTDWEKVIVGDGDQQIRTDKRLQNAWTMTGGSPDRNASASIGMPITTVKWAYRLHGNENDEQAILQSAERARARGSVLLPRIEARTTNDLVLVKSPSDMLMAIDFESGTLRWPFYFHSAPFDVMPHRGFETTEGSTEAPRELLARIWGRSSFGQFACDQNNFYFVTSANQPTLSSRNMFTVLPRNLAETWNHLEGVSIGQEGALIWRIGGAKSDEPSLANAYFLGPPTPYAGQLYALAEVNGETRLVVLNPQNGRLLWSQQLIHSPTNLISNDQQLQSQAISPAIGDGVIVCATGHGAVVAVDMTSRNLLWAHHYAPQRATSQFGFSTDSYAFDVLEERWCEPNTIMYRGLVILATPEDNELHCLDAVSGNLLWKKLRGKGRYVAGVFNDRVVVLGNNAVSRYFLSDGSPGWSSDTTLPSGEFIAGKPIRQDGVILVPTTAKRVLKIDLESGKIIATASVDRPLGNLFSYKNQLISVSATEVSAYFTKEHLATEVEARLAVNASDTWGLNQKAQLELADNRIDSAIALLEKSYSLDSASDETRYLLIRSLLSGLKSDPDRYLPFAEKLDHAIEIGPQRFDFYVNLAMSNLRRGQHVQAFDRLLQLMHDRRTDSAPQTQKRLDRVFVDTRHEVDADAWIAAQLSNCFEKAAPSDRQAMRTVVLRELAEAQKLTPGSQRELLSYFRWLPDAQENILSVAQELLNETEQSAAENFLRPLLSVGDALVRSLAGQLMSKETDFDRTRFRNYDPDLFDPDSFAPGRRIRPAERNDIESSAAPKNIDEEIAWPRGMVYDRIIQDSVPTMGGTPIGMIGNRYGRPEYSLRVNGSSVFVFNQFGNIVGQFEIERSSMENNDAILRGQTDGGMLLLETYTEIIALDIYRGMVSPNDSMLWRHSLSTAGPAKIRASPSSIGEDNSLGARALRREFADGTECWVGPITPAGVIVKKGTEVAMLDLLSGETLWKRSGFSNRTALAADGLNVALVDSSTGFSHIFDARDGAAQRQVEYRGDWKPWISNGPVLAEYATRVSDTPTDGIQHAGNLPTAIRLFNVMTGEVLAEKEFEVGSRASICSDRYIAVLEPKGNLWFCDLVKAKAKEHAIQPLQNLRAISLQQFQKRLVLLTSCQSSAPASNQLVVVGRASSSAGQSNFVVNGPIFGIDVLQGELLWDRAGKLYQFQFALDQPRGSPLAVFHRIVRSTTGGQPLGGIAVVDLRNGRLVYGTNSIRDMGETIQSQVELEPAKSVLTISFGRQATELEFTSDPMPPQPVCNFGFISQSIDLPKNSPLFEFFPMPAK